MKLQYYLLTGLCTASLLGLSSCFDSDYDLTDIDTTAKIEMKSLTLPVNVDYITLDQALDIEEGSEVVKENIDGKVYYAVKKSGNFNSDPIDIKEFSTSKPSISPKTKTLELTDLRNLVGYVGEINAYYDIKDIEPSEFESSAEGIDEAIKYVKEIGGEAHISNVLSLKGLSESVLKKISINNLKIQYPKGLVAETNHGKYDKATGVLDLSDETLTLDSKGNVELVFSIKAIDVEQSNVKIDYEKHNLTYADKLYVISGRINMSVDANDDIPNTVTFSSTPEISEIKVKTFTGKIEYKVDDISIDPIHLSSIPEILSQSGTSIVLDNPQIYMKFNNPLSEYNTVIETGLEITAVNGNKSKTYSIDDKVFRTNTDSENQFVLSPKKPEVYYSEYKNPTHVKFTSLSNVLADVDGIPTEMMVDVKAPYIPEQEIKEFKLGEKLESVKGKYDFYAPLKLGKETVIVYTDTLHGWNDEEVDNISLSKVIISLDVSTEVPMNVELWASPAGVDNKVINNIKSNTVTIDANAKKQHIELVMEGDIKHLNGVIFKAVAKSINNGDILSPDMKIYVDNFKLNVTGSYEKEL